ncbi:MAG: hypothetical protein RR920_08780 [Lachnospiraceae bacterium]
MRIESKKINVGIGFVTGRKNFKNVLRAYLNNWNECSTLDRKKYALHLFVAYDLKYSGTNVSDYNIIEEDILGTVDSALYIGKSLISSEARNLMKKKIATAKELKLIFGEGYAMKRNSVLYFALKNKMDSLIFLDDDEYPIANIQVNESTVWKGQDVLTTHIQNIAFADITHGHHCGYISPIPYMKFNDDFSEPDFRMLIEAVSNDIITWESVKKKMTDGGVTYADLDIIDSMTVKIVKEVGGMKFISGANLGFNLTDPTKLFPFYNPPGARGEDTFLSTCIGECDIRKVPCYTFHDGFLAYPRLLSGVLPNVLKTIDISTSTNYKRFLKASIGWIRYKPLLLLITNSENYQAEIQEIKKKLAIVIPKICTYFGNNDFCILLKELDFYDMHVYEHFQDFQDTKGVWLKVVAFLDGDHTNIPSIK